MTDPEWVSLERDCPVWVPCGDDKYVLRPPEVLWYQEFWLRLDYSGLSAYFFTRDYPSSVLDGVIETCIVRWEEYV